MSKLKPSDYTVLNLSGDNWLEWAMNTSVVLMSRELRQCITQSDYVTESENNRTITIMRHHLTEELRNQYIHIKNPHDIWTELKSRYTMVLLPKVRHEWMSLRFQDFESVEEYHLALSKIIYKLRLCGEVVTDVDLLLKTHSTVHPGDLLSRHICMEKDFTTYNDMLSCLLTIEQKKRSEMRPLEANMVGLFIEEFEGAVSKIRDYVAGLSID